MLYKIRGFHGDGCEEYEEEREVSSSERHYGWGGTEYIIGFEGSQALPVCPSGMAVKNAVF
jgi:hypothetical protein